MNKFVGPLLFAVIFSNPAMAHVDRILPIDSDGAIQDVPAEFGKVRLNVRGLGTKKPFIQVSIGSHQTTLPECVSQKLYSKSRAEITASGSWYHGEGMPPYLSIEFFKPGYDPKATFSSHDVFVFDLHDAKLIYARRFTATHNGGRYQDFILPIGCRL